MAETNTEKLVVANDQRIGAIGRTGMGKTFLMKALCKEQPRVLVIDSKQRVNWPGYALTMHPDAALLGDSKKVIYRHGEDGIPDYFWNRAMRFMHEQGGGVIYIDEIPMLTRPNFAPQGLLNILRIGRELGVGVWWSAQEATGVANTVIRQTDVLALFHNHGASDRDKLIGIVGDIAESAGHLKEYEFVLYRADGIYDASAINVYEVNDNAST